MNIEEIIQECTQNLSVVKLEFKPNTDLTQLYNMCLRGALSMDKVNDTKYFVYTCIGSYGWKRPLYS